MELRKLITEIKDILYSGNEYLVHLYEMAQPEGKVRDRIRDLSVPIFEHLIKASLLGSDKGKLHHWSAELVNWFDQCMKTKIKKRKYRYPTEQELIKWLTDYFTDYTDIERIRTIIEKRYQRHSNISNEVLYENTVNAIKEICSLLVNNEVTIEDMERILDKYVLVKDEQ